MSKNSAGFSLPSWNVTSKSLLGLALTASVLVTSGQFVGAQSQSVCLGLTPDSAAAAGYVVQIGTPGNDLITGVDGVRNFIMGNGGDDEIIGGNIDDVICGGAGDDDILGRQGNDRVAGNGGDDIINLGDGNDVASGGSGDDNLVGDFGNDRLNGNGGADRISGEAGNDIIRGSWGPDVIFGGSGNDELSGFVGDDRIAGGPGDDRILSGAGNDIVSGDDGNDTIFGQLGDDVLDGDAGFDTLNSGPGNDRCDRSDGDSIRGCEVDFAPAPPPEEVAPIVVSPSNIAPPTGAPVPAAQAPQGVNEFGWPLLTDTGLSALLFCESSGNHGINTGNNFYGGVQWIPATWDSAARLAGFDEYIGVLPHLVPADVQDTVTFVWWEATRPNTQWPTCHARAMEAMNVLAP